MASEFDSKSFWDQSQLEAELKRVSDICNGCRRCYNLCPSFNDLIDRLDTEAVDGDAEKLTREDFNSVTDLCYQCKLCYNHCPYTPPHRWQVDFPRLMLRARAADARQNGVSLRDRLLGNTEWVGKLGSLTAPLSNWANELAVHRAFVQAVAGIHRARIRDKVKSLAAAAGDGREIVALGPTCSYMLKREYPWLDGSEDARLVASRTRDVFEFLARLRAEGRLDTNFVRPVGAIAYHVP